MDPMGYTVMADIMSNPPDLKRALGNCKGFCFWLESVESDVVSLVERHEAKMTPQKHGFSIPTKIPWQGNRQVTSNIQDTLHGTISHLWKAGKSAGKCFGARDMFIIPRAKYLSVFPLSISTIIHWLEKSLSASFQQCIHQGQLCWNRQGSWESQFQGIELAP